MRASVAAPQRGEIEVEDDVAVEDEDGLVADPAADVPRAAARAEDLALERVRHVHAELAAVADGAPDGARPVVEVDHHLLHAVRRQHLERPVQERPIEDGQHGLGAIERERPHPRAEARGQDDGPHLKTISPVPPEARNSPT
jgi:hypothetical protein